jgi:hypothetical protein
MPTENNRGERAGENISFWERTATKFYREPLNENVATAICVIGAGIAGVTTAYLLAREGWDLCHGSRFDALGRVLNGPAITDLEPIEASAEKETLKFLPVRC